MLNLLGKSLTLTLPIETIMKVGYIDEGKDIKDFLCQIWKNEYDSNLTDYCCNIIFLPVIIKNMIERNLTLKESVELSRHEFALVSLYWKESVEMLKNNQSFDTIKDTIDKCNNIFKSMRENDEDAFPNISIKLDNISDEFSNVLLVSGVYLISEKIGKYANKVLNENFKEPLYKIICNLIRNYFRNIHNVEDEMAFEMFKPVVQESIEQLVEVQQINLVLSKILSKAINDDISFIDSLKTFNYVDLAEDIINELTNDKALIKYGDEFQVALEKLIGVIGTI